MATIEAPYTSFSVEGSMIVINGLESHRIDHLRVRIQNTELVIVNGREELCRGAVADYSGLTGATLLLKMADFNNNYTGGATGNPGMDAARGVGGNGSERKFGLIPEMDIADGELEVWNDPAKGDKNRPELNKQYDVTATAADAGKQVMITALKDDGSGNWDEVQYTVTLIDGTVCTAAGEEGIRMNRAEVLGVDSNLGVISINVSGGAIQGYINIGEGNTQNSQYTVPSSTLNEGTISGVRILNFVLSIMREKGTSGGRSGEIDIYTQKFGGASVLQTPVGFSANGTSIAQIKFEAPELFPPPKQRYGVLQLAKLMIPAFSASYEMIIEK